MLRCALAAINRARSPAEYVRLSLFPTPAAGYFARCAGAATCKPHLIRIARELRLSGKGTTAVPRGRGWLFTRFMLAGFAIHRALEQLGVDTFESYPYLVFSLWKRASERLPPKSDRRAASKARQAILARLTRGCRLTAPLAKSLDEADAAVLAVTAHLSASGRGGALTFHSPRHGRFLLALSTRDLASARAVETVSRSPLRVDGLGAKERTGAGVFSAG
jgi:predicted nuclease with RNAse H fold